MQQSSSTVVITGASGFLGRAVLEHFSQMGPAIGLGHRQAAGAVIPLDMRDREALTAFLRKERPGLVIHCAAYRDPDFCETHPDETRRLNVEPVRTFVDVLPDSARLAFISSDYVFDGQNPPYAEESPRHPINVYGTSKKEAEDMVMERSGNLILRIPLLMGYGPTFDSSGFIAKTAQAIMAGKPVDLDDRTLRFPTDIRDVAAALAFLMNGGAAGVYHVAGARGQTQYAWALELAELMQADAGPIRPTEAHAVRKAARPANSQLSTERIRAMGFERFMDFKEVAGKVLALRV